MKRLLGFLLLVTLIGCTCLAQVPTQTVYADETCEAALPDYTLLVSVSDNCDVLSYTQTPVAGTLLTITNPLVNVLLEVTDVGGNVSQTTFDVVLLDTIPPVFNFPAEMLALDFKQAGSIYRVFEAFVQEQMLAWIDYEPRWDTVTFNREADPIMLFRNTIVVDQDMYATYLERE